MTTLDAWLKQGIEALHAKRYKDAVDALSMVVADDELATDEDLIDIRARTLSLFAQALMELGELEQADHVVLEAMRLVRKLGDADGMNEVRELQDKIAQARMEAFGQLKRMLAQREIRNTPLEDLLAKATDPLERVDVLMKKAHAHADTDEHEVGAQIARQAVEEADALGDVRARVLARIAMARHRTDLEDAKADLGQAHTIAADADETNLVSTVVRAADISNIALPEEPGPHLGHVD